MVKINEDLYTLVNLKQFKELEARVEAIEVKLDGPVEAAWADD